MSNILDQYFEEALRRIPTQPALADSDPPLPDYPENESFDPADDDKDQLTPVEEHFKSAKKDDHHDEDILTITEEQRGLLDGGIREAGFDVYAFYKSRRYISAHPYPGKWGIFYLEHGVARIRELIDASVPENGSSERRAYEFLRAHERFHLKFDLYALSIEAIMGRALYEPLKHAFRHHRFNQIEEALANRDAWEWAKREAKKLEEPNRDDFEKLTYDFMKLQPGAYARFDENKSDLTSELAANLLDLNLSQTARREEQKFWVGNVPSGLLHFHHPLYPEYFVRPAALTTWINPAWKMPDVHNITEAPAFTSLLSSRYPSLKNHWVNTKKKLIENAAIPGLDFKRWDKSTGHWSVRINDNFRAHLRLIDTGTWMAEEFGPHKAMGHG